MNKNIDKNQILLTGSRVAGVFVYPMTWIKNYGNDFYKYYCEQPI
jgi:hypothetical protein